MTETQTSVYKFIRQSRSEAVDVMLALRLSHEDVYGALIGLEAMGKAVLQGHKDPAYRTWAGV